MGHAVSPPPESHHNIVINMACPSNQRILYAHTESKKRPFCIFWGCFFLAFVKCHGNGRPPALISIHRFGMPKRPSRDLRIFIDEKTLKKWTFCRQKVDKISKIGASEIFIFSGDVFSGICQMSKRKPPKNRILGFPLKRPPNPERMVAIQ